MAAIRSQIGTVMGQSMAMLAQPVTYTPFGGDPISTVALVESVSSEVDTETDTSLVTPDRVFRIFTSSLRVDDAPIQPQREDTISITIDGRTFTYSVMIPTDKRDCWE